VWWGVVWCAWVCAEAGWVLVEQVNTAGLGGQYLGGSADAVLRSTGLAVGTGIQLVPWDQGSGHSEWVAKHMGPWVCLGPLQVNIKLAIAGRHVA
jgi:hypothetical protein